MSLTDRNSALRLKNILHDEHEIIPKLINNAGAPQTSHCRGINLDFCVIFIELVIDKSLLISFIIALDTQKNTFDCRKKIFG